MFLADTYRAIAYAARAIPGAQFGLREHSITLVRKYTNGSPRTVVGSEEIPIVEGSGQNPKFRLLSEEERTLGGLPEGAAEVANITPAFPGGGTDIALLRGDDLQQGDMQWFRVVGPMYPRGANFALIQVKQDHATHIVMRIKPTELEAVGP
ncbi:MAG TPA: hypothetical protein VGK73_20690 [Polyangiaceae bacterium]